MQPAFSVIFLTTLIGMGQGLFLAIYTEQIYSLLNVLPHGDKSEFYAIGSAIALALLGLGLIASMFHLGHPERAWRAATQWRTSWLSREVIALPIFMGLLFSYGLIHYLHWNIVLITIGAVSIDLSVIVGVFAMIAAILLFLSTGMIYACLKFLQEWHSPLTVINYVLLGSASGFTLSTLLASLYAPQSVNFYAGWAIVLTLLGFAFRYAALFRNKRLRPKSTVQTAIGIRHSKINQKSMGFMGGSVNTRDFFHNKTKSTILFIKYSFISLVFYFPIILFTLYLFEDIQDLLMVALVSQYLGLLAERWYFFADANHPQNIYYQSIS